MAALAQQLDLFDAARWPRRPYCTDDLSAGLQIRDHAHALQRAYVQHNPPAMVFWMVADIDRPEAGAAWIDAGLPAPAWICQTPKSGHAHIAYGLAVPVCRSDAARPEPMRLAAAVERGLWSALGADTGYAGLVTKTPGHPAWRTLYPQPGGGLYELNELAEYVELKPPPRKREAAGLGRNCDLFDRLRSWAYRAIRQGWPEYGRWLTAVRERAHGLNTYATPLPVSEIEATAKSVAKWTYANITQQGFSAVQAARGARGGRAKGQAYADKRERAQALRAEGRTQAAIGVELGVSQMTVSRWLKQ